MFVTRNAAPTLPRNHETNDNRITKLIKKPLDSHGNALILKIFLELTSFCDYFRFEMSSNRCCGCCSRKSLTCFFALSGIVLLILGLTFNIGEVLQKWIQKNIDEVGLKGKTVSKLRHNLFTGPFGSAG